MPSKSSLSKLTRDIQSLGERLWKPQEMGLLILVLLLAAGAWSFVELADEVSEGDLQSVDEKILLAMRNPADSSDPIGPKWVEELGRDFTALGGVAVLTMLTLAVVVYLLILGKHHLAIFVAATVGGGILASFLMKFGFSRPRPDLVPHESYVYTSSFPSGHSMMSAITYLTLAALLVRAHARRAVRVYLLSLAILLTVAVGVSRVYLGVHWPTDVLAGWTAGAVWAIGCGLIARFLQYRGQIEPPEPDPKEPEETATQAA